MKLKRVVHKINVPGIVKKFNTTPTFARLTKTARKMAQLTNIKK